MDTPIPHILDSTKLVYTYEYPRPAVTVDLVVMCRSESVPHCIMVERGKEPYKGMWALPGGFLDEGETTLAAAIRELKEETGYVTSDANGTPRLIGVYDRPDRDPRGRVISVAYLITVNEMKPVKGDDDAAQADWRPMNAYPLAFDHEQIVTDAWRRSKCFA